MIAGTPVKGLYRALVAKDVDAVDAVLADDVRMGAVRLVPYLEDQHAFDRFFAPTP